MTAPGETGPDGAVLRPAQADDVAFLREMLYEAAVVGRDRQPPSEVLGEPEIARYLDAWMRPDDRGVVAVAKGSPAAPDGALLGAAWYRRFRADEPGYGFVDEETPELAIACRADARAGAWATVWCERCWPRLRPRAGPGSA